MHDSSARAYPPRCHPGTRKRLRSHISRWGVGNGSNRRMLWVLGPAAVGKSAVAQATAEEFDEMERFGASFFFSRQSHINNPDWVIPTLVYQLATKYRQYKHIITQRLVDDPLILEKNRRVQFRKLIIEPFRILMIEYPDTIREPLLIILDGLDECEDKEAQVEFINLISTHVRQVDKFPLRWMVCSRPEWHLQTALSNSDFEVVCERQELKVHDPEARADVRRPPGTEFDRIRMKYKDRLPNDWPDNHHLFQIAVAASGDELATFSALKIWHSRCGWSDDTISRLKGSKFGYMTSALIGAPNIFRKIVISCPRNSRFGYMVSALIETQDVFDPIDVAKFVLWLYSLRVQGGIHDKSLIRVLPGDLQAPGSVFECMRVSELVRTHPCCVVFTGAEVAYLDESNMFIYSYTVIRFIA
ncbi:hypothetical protein P691DRAFT_726831 [Macrolepiota fuliginosa MF-IS2]|uniref:Nephrocystin 3-like N-terminal domain-containing protein n=1 Tax=Macrolepiota fuliginosa MF-IS2 TaxID=1400762 RepID=A0A9P5XFI1_9AGAR|nr:hypothetical protein P691DRAFT_726831 [Macrolepiota fuliginosa MF-IS2]